MIIATMIISNRNEPFLKACLDSLNDAVDLVVINDNSSDKDNPNLDIVKGSQFYKEDKVKLLFHPFKGFDDARNKYLEYIHSLKPDKNTWVIKIDSDEVHPVCLKTVTRDILPALPEKVGVVDSYFYHFMQSFDYIFSIDRRHDLFVRYTPSLKWTGSVHEKLTGQSGSRIVLPYLFYHYGYVTLKDEVLEKWKLYAQCGDATYSELDKVEKDSFLNWEGRYCVRFKESHPVYMQSLIEELKETRKQEFDNYSDVIENHIASNKSLGIKNHLRHLNYRFRVYSRFMQLSIRVPGLAAKFYKLLRK
ncbi:MAG: glycosyltransferase [Armatimonadota bacterium]